MLSLFCRLQDCLDSENDEDCSAENFSFVAQQVSEFTSDAEGERAEDKSSGSDEGGGKENVHIYGAEADSHGESVDAGGDGLEKNQL